MYCDECIKKEIDKMSYEEVSDMYMEGKEWLDNIKFNKKDPQAKEMVDNFRKGWFALLNMVLLTKEKQQK